MPALAPLLLIAAAAPAQGAAEGALLHPIDAYLRGDPAALAVSADERTLFSAEGGVVRELDLDADPPAERAVVAVDAATVALCATPERLLVAGGSQGLFVVELGDDARPVRRVEDRGDSVCTGVAATADRVLALFAARDASVLVAYDRATLERAAEAPLGPGTAWALALDGDRAFVAMGPGGLVRVDLGGDALAVRPGPRGADAFPTPEGLGLEPGVVRELAVGGGRLYAATDAGLAVVDLDAPWSPDTPVAVHRLRAGGRPTYARRVAVRGDRLALGTNAGPSEVLDGAPYSAFGKLGGQLVLAAVDPADYRRGDEQHLYLFDVRGDALEPVARERPGGAWRGLVLGEERVYEQHIRTGLVVRSWTDDGVRELWRARPDGLPSADGVFSVARPARLLFGVDSAGARPVGALELDAGRLAPRAIASEGEFALGLLPSEPWPAGDGAEWLVDGDGFALRLHRLTHRAGVAVETWSLPLPEDPDGRRGHTYLHALRADDLLLVARHGSRYGLVGWDADALVAEARGTAPGGVLATPPRFQAATHPPGDAAAPDGSERCFRVAATRLPDGRRLVAVAAGYDAAEGRALLLLYDASAAPADAPARLAAARGDDRLGNAIAVAFARADDRVWAVVADACFGVRTFDVTDPSAPRAGGTWEAPPNAFDGYPDNALDVAVRGGRAYVACSRLGLVCLDVSDPGAGPLPVVGVRDTPGLAYGVALGEVDGEPRLAVGDHQAGVRVYGPAPE